MKAAPRETEEVAISATTIPDRVWRFVPPLVVFGVSLAVYCATLAPSITWQNGGADSGDLATAVALGGVSHPTGYPLYMVLGRIVRVLPFGPDDLAGRLAFFSALETAAGVTFIYLAVYTFLKDMAETRAWRMSATGVALATAFGVAFTPIIWSQANIAEVYGLNLFFFGLILWLLAVYRHCRMSVIQPPSGLEKRTGATGRLSRLLYIGALVAGLAVAHHRTALFTVAAGLTFLFVLEVEIGPGVGRLLRTIIGHWRIALICVALFVGGVVVPQLYALRAGSAPPPANWGGGDWWWLLSATLYRPFVFGYPLPTILARLNTTLFSWLTTFTIANVFAIIGIVRLWLKSPKGLSETRSIGAFVSVALVLHLLFATSYAADNTDIYTIPALATWLVAAGLGAGLLLAWPLYRFSAENLWPSMALSAVLLAGPCALLLANYTAQDIHADNGALAYATKGLAALSPGAIVLSYSDETTFALWYGQRVLHLRPDVAIVEVRLLQFDWYQAGLHQLYPGLKIPDQPNNGTVMRANADRPLYITDATILPYDFDIESTVTAVERTGQHLYLARLQV